MNQSSTRAVPRPGRALRGGRAGVRWPAVALAALILITVGGSWVSARAQRVGVVADSAGCPVTMADLDFPARPGRDRLVLPAGYAEDAPIDARWCRFDEQGALLSGWRVDAARTARLAALLVAPAAGWPDDALAAKRIVPLTDSELTQLAAPPCSSAVPGEYLVFRYGQGPDSAVLLRAAPCADADNGLIRLRAPSRVLDELAALAPVD